MMLGATLVKIGQRAMLALDDMDVDVADNFDTILAAKIGVGGIGVGDAVMVMVGVGADVGVGVELGIGVGVGIAVGLGVGVEVGAAHVGTVIVSASVETVPPNANALPVHDTVLPMVIPAASISVPANVEFAPSVVAPVGVQKTSQADAPPNATVVPAVVLSAPVLLKIYVPPLCKVIPETTDIAPVIQ